MKSVHLGLVLAAVLTAAGSAQDPEPEGLPSLDLTAPRPLRVDVTGGVWIPRLKGNSRLDGSFVDFDTQLSLRDAAATPYGELTIRKDGRWHLHLSGFRFARKDSTTFEGVDDFGSLALRDGDPVRSELRLTSFAAEVGYATKRYPETPDSGRIRLAPTLGLRWVDLDQRIEQVGVGRESPDGAWAGVMVGALLNLEYQLGERFPFFERVEVRGHTAVGPALGGDGGTMWELRADLTAFLDPRVGVRVGFRLLQLDVERDEYEFDGSLQGMFLALTIRF